MPKPIVMMLIKGILLVSAGSSLAADTQPATAATTQPARERTFTNKKHKVRFKAPGDMEFEKVEVKGIIAQYRSKPLAAGGEAPLELIQMMVIEDGKPLRDVDLKDVIGGMKEKVERGGGKEIHSEATKLGGAPAHDFTWSREISGNQVEMKQIVTIRDGRAYVLSFIAEAGKLEPFLKRAQVARDSFEWLK